jgi:hypothetical protein
MRSAMSATFWENFMQPSLKLARAEGKALSDPNPSPFGQNCLN